MQLGASEWILIYNVPYIVDDNINLIMTMLRSTCSLPSRENICSCCGLLRDPKRLVPASFGSPPSIMPHHTKGRFRRDSRPLPNSLRSPCQQGFSGMPSIKILIILSMICWILWTLPRLCNRGSCKCGQVIALVLSRSCRPPELSCLPCPECSLCMPRLLQ